MEALKIANSLPMWIACGLAVLLIIVQAVIFLKNSYDTGKKIGISEEQMKKAIKSSAITSIGPSIVILSGMLSLLITVGAPMAWMRLSLIGSVMFESVAAGIGTNAVGVKLCVDELTPIALTMGVWTMALGSIGWIIFATFSSSKMDKVQRKISGGDTNKLIMISISAIIGVFSALAAQNLIGLNRHALACVLGGLIMGLLIVIGEKKNIKWLKEWNLTIAILASIIITSVI